MRARGAAEGGGRGGALRGKGDCRKDRGRRRRRRRPSGANGRGCRVDPVPRGGREEGGGASYELLLLCCRRRRHRCRHLRHRRELRLRDPPRVREAPRGGARAGAQRRRRQGAAAGDGEGEGGRGEGESEMRKERWGRGRNGSKGAKKKLFCNTDAGKEITLCFRTTLLSLSLSPSLPTYPPWRPAA